MSRGEGAIARFNQVYSDKAQVEGVKKTQRLFTIALTAWTTIESQ
jgi:hypothetical protein